MTNDISKLAREPSVDPLMCYDNGGIVDDLIIYRSIEKHSFW